MIASLVLLGMLLAVVSFLALVDHRSTVCELPYTPEIEVPEAWAATLDVELGDTWLDSPRHASPYLVPQCRPAPTVREWARLRLTLRLQYGQCLPRMRARTFEVAA